jgi:hypothetical protein
MQDLFRDPENFAHHFERYAGSLVSNLGLGRRIDTMDDHILKLALKDDGRYHNGASPWVLLDRSNSRTAIPAGLDISSADSVEKLRKCCSEILVGAGL